MMVTVSEGAFTPACLVWSDHLPPAPPPMFPTWFISYVVVRKPRSKQLIPGQSQSDSDGLPEWFVFKMYGERCRDPIFWG